MKIFLDGALRDQIYHFDQLLHLDGVTTNPTHLSAAGYTIDTFMEYVEQLAGEFPHLEISVQVTEHDPEAIYRQAKEISRLAENIVVKIPCAINYYPIIAQLAKEGISINVTLVFSLAQALCMAKFSVTYISFFVGRALDAGIDAYHELGQITDMKQRYGFDSQILAASIRDYTQFVASVTTGSDVVTVPGTVLERLLAHPLTDLGIKIFDNAFTQK